MHEAARRGKKTVFISAMPVDGRSASGIAYYAAELAQGLLARGEDIEIWANVDARDDDTLRNRIVRRWRYGRAWHELLAPLLIERPSLVHLQYSLFLYGAHAFGAFAAPVALFAICKLARIPVVVTLHDLPSPHQITDDYVRMHRYHYKPLFVRLALRALFGGVVTQAERVIVHHEVFRTTLVREYGCPPERAQVVPHGLFRTTSADRLLSRELFGLAPTAFVAGFFGYAAPYKGLEVLLGAAERLAAAGDSSMVFLIGAGRQPSRAGDRAYEVYYAKLQRRARALGNVQWVGYVRDEDVAAFYTSCDVAVFPYVAFQGASGPMSIATSYGVPFFRSSVVSRAAGYGSDATVEPDPGALAAKLLRFRDDAAFRARIIDRCNEDGRALRAVDPWESTSRLYAATRA